ncbi:hypothetical protein QW060_05545 [Myroides ceti]|uniref:Uncharacterized protein n=1 Tax=Paenimyroides ceti TaxID=395087 RepID=A0ABT8CQ06_9FLAO|nr:hypothetical protein [Paenimyroides ceti]MDN3706592.1 hypothetical protein [Paenimyroides ceti]
MGKDTITIPLLSEDDTPIPNTHIKKADLLPHIKSRLETQEKKEHPILDTTIPYRDNTNTDLKKQSLHQLIEKLNVEENLRYQKTAEDTYCNVYSYDYCYFSNVYLPTVWWTDDALERVLKGEEVEAIFGETVDRIYSSAIHDWFLQWGSSFGWKRVDSVDTLQNLVNTNGGIGIICAKRKVKGLSGHIVPVVPENANHKAHRVNGVVVYPLQSQAGKLNYNYFSEARKDWWQDDLYSSFVLYYHD